MATSIYLNPTTKFQASYSYNKYVMNANVGLAAGTNQDLVFNTAASTVNISGIATLAAGKLQFTASGMYWISPAVAFSVGEDIVPDIKYEMTVTRASGAVDPLIVYASRLGAAAAGTEYIIPTSYSGYFGPGDVVNINVANRAAGGPANALNVLNNRTALVLTKLY